MLLVDKFKYVFNVILSSFSLSEAETLKVYAAVESPVDSSAQQYVKNIGDQQPGDTTPSPRNSNNGMFLIMCVCLCLCSTPDVLHNKHFSIHYLWKSVLWLKTALVWKSTFGILELKPIDIRYDSICLLTRSNTHYIVKLFHFRSRNFASLCSFTAAIGQQCSAVYEQHGWSAAWRQTPIFQQWENRQWYVFNDMCVCVAT